MKIIIPVIGFSRAGGERVLSKLATELVHLGCNVSFVVLDNKGEPYYPTEANIIKVQTSHKKNKLLKTILNFFEFIRVCRNENPDIVISGLNVTAYISMFLKAKKKKVYYVQAYETLFYKSKMMKFLVYLTYRLPLNKIVNSPKLLPSNINNYIGIVPAGVDTNLFCARDLTVTNKCKTIGIIGRKEKHKGTRDIIEALVDIPKENDFILNIAVYLDEECKALLNENNIKYKFFPIESDNDLAEFYRENDLLIACGLIEDGAFHYPCAEGMASGSVVISNYCPLYDLDSKFKLEKFDKEDVIKKINYFFSMSEKEINLEVNRNINKIQEYSWDIIGKKFFKILKK